MTKTNNQYFSFTSIRFTLTSILPLIVLIVACVSCSQSEQADLIIINSDMYTADDLSVFASAVAVKDGRIMHIGNDNDIKSQAGNSTTIIDAKGKFLMPGFIEGHGHFLGLGKSLMELNFLRSKDWEEITALVAEKAKDTPKGQWIIGRGWHQEKWDQSPQPAYLGYPYPQSLSDATPDHPVLLVHASGHSLYANQKAMDLAGLSADTPNPDGGLIVKDPQGQMLGVFEENAMQVIARAYNSYEEGLDPKLQEKYWHTSFNIAQEACLQNGITSFQDAGTSYTDIENYKLLIKENKLKIRLWTMLRHSYDEMKNRMDGLPIINAGDHHFSCRAVKTEVDGALGSYGAWLIDPYHDKPGFIGQNTTTLEEVDRIATLAAAHDMQLCVHAIGDRANQQVLNIFEHRMPEGKRWRIEHAQHLHKNDIPRFNEIGAIASMQAVHCTSDAPFVEKRLGVERAHDGAYAWRSIIDSGGRLANGTDAPVENVSALESIYASVTRKRTDNQLIFFPEQKMTRDEALKSYTIWNAYAGFEDAEKGSITVGKLADFVLLSNNLLTCPEDDILSTDVLVTIVGGKVYDYRSN